MQYVFLIVGVAWACQFLLSYWQLQRFHRQLAELRKRGRCSVGVAGSRWMGRTYGILVIDTHERVQHAALFSGWTVFSKLRPVAGLAGADLDAILSTPTPVAQLQHRQWLALQHAAQFLRAQPIATVQTIS